MDVVDNPARSRYELVVDGQTAFVDYRLGEGTIVFTWSQTPPALRGQGIGERLVRGALDDARRRGLRARALCGFVASVARRPEYADLMA